MVVRCGMFAPPREINVFATRISGAQTSENRGRGARSKHVPKSFVRKNHLRG